jgi:hypothetical protein
MCARERDLRSRDRPGHCATEPRGAACGDDRVARCGAPKPSREFLEINFGRVAQSVLPTRFQNKLRHLQRRMEPNYEVNDRREFYIDCDLYSSTKTVMAFLGSRLKHGMIVALDDYYCYSATGISGERLACLDFLASKHPLPLFSLRPVWMGGDVFHT